jgi:ATP-dependent Lon protease
MNELGAALSLKQYAVLPLRDIVIFPKMVATLYVGRHRSVAALKTLRDESDQYLFVVAQKDADCDQPREKDLFHVGTVCRVLQIIELQENTQKILVEGVCRATIHQFVLNQDYDEVLVREQEEDLLAVEREKHLMPVLENKFREYSELSDIISQDVLLSLHALNDVSAYADLISVHISLSIEERQGLLEMINLHQRIERVLYFLVRDIQRIKMMKRIRENVKEKFVKEQEKMLSAETLKAYKNELGINDDPMTLEINDFEKKIKTIQLSDQARSRCQAELSKLKLMPPMSAEATVIRNYLDVVLQLPWSKQKVLNHNLIEAEKVLDEDHYGLEKVKDAILEIMSVQLRTMHNKDQQAPIMCLVGPPGVGKTSLAKSIARAMGRDFVRISLGGVRDESEIRGHRRTYIGAMPGRIIKSISRAGSSNCLVLLDEIDKMGTDFRGDPASALLEVLDSEQNQAFNDHYLELDYDLSSVMFITTANTLDIPQPLFDRMEIIRISGYTHQEKMQIVTSHLMPKLLKQNGVKANEIEVSPGAIDEIIAHHTRESGVRDLRRQISKLLRKVVREIESNRIVAEKVVRLGKSQVQKYLGPESYQDLKMYDKEPIIGCVNGLAWTPSGGQILTIEALVLPGTGQLVYTGSLGDVMQESIKASLSLIKNHTANDKPSSFYQKHDIHIHVPEGATPKDGPSAGITISTAILSAITQRAVRPDVAMTGEITLHGKVLKIGGLKEKLLAAQRSGIRQVLIPKENEKDLKAIPGHFLKGISVIPVEKIQQVFEQVIV